MSLDIYLQGKTKTKRPASSGIFVRENGKTIEISEEEWKRRYPGREPVRFKPEDTVTNELYHDNITHNLGIMARECGLYAALWCPDEHGWTTTKDILQQLMDGYRDLCARPDVYQKFNPKNGWGSYEVLVEFTGNYILACIRYPEAKIEVSR